MSLREIFEGNPDDIVLSQPGLADLKRRDLRELQVATNSFLHSRGIPQGSRVGINIENEGAVEVTSLLGVMANHTAVPYYGMTSDECRRYLRSADLSCVIVGDAQSVLAKTAMQMRIPVHVLRPKQGGKAGEFFFDQKTAVRRIDTPADHDPKRVPLIIHTSGTTSEPKKVPLTNINLDAIVDNSRHAFNLTANDRLLSTFERVHISGVVSVMSTLAAGGSVYCTKGMKPEEFAKTLSDSKATWYSTVPPTWQSILRHANNRPLSELAPGHCLKKLRISAMHVPPRLMHDVATFVGKDATVYNAYSMTEAGQTAIMAHGEAGMRPSSPQVDIRVMSEKGMPLPEGQEGDIYVAGPHVTSGYLDNGQTEHFANIGGKHFFRTGDVGVMKDGKLQVIGRKKEVIMGPDISTSPTEIEDVLRQHAAVSDVAIFPVKNIGGAGEKVTAAVVLNKDVTVTSDNLQEIADGLRKFAGLKLKAEKLPEGFVFLPSLPVDPVSNKVQRLQMAERLGLPDGFDGVRHYSNLPEGPSQQGMRYE